MNIVEIEHLSAGYGTGQVLFDVSIKVKEGEVVSLLGRNGAGKTTTMRCVAGAKPPYIQSGTIRINDEDITNHPTHKRADKGIGYVPEERRVWPGLTITENIRMATKNVKNPLSLDRVLSYFPRLQELDDKAARNLSGGEQQMLAIGRAPMGDPDLLLDESTLGLHRSSSTTSATASNRFGTGRNRGAVRTERDVRDGARRTSVPARKRPNRARGDAGDASGRRVHQRGVPRRMTLPSSVISLCRFATLVR